MSISYDLGAEKIARLEREVARLRAENARLRQAALVADGNAEHWREAFGAEMRLHDETRQYHRESIGALARRLERVVAQRDAADPDRVKVSDR